MRRALVPVAALVAVLALVAAGCGGSSDKKANEAYANGVCSAVSAWEQQVKAIATDFSSGISKASLQGKVTQVEAATKTLVSDIKAVPPPNTSQGQAAKQQLDQLSTDATTTIDAAKTSIDALPASPSVGQMTGVALTLAPQVKSLIDAGKSALGTLKDAGGSLADAFKGSKTCQGLVPNS